MVTAAKNGTSDFNGSPRIKRTGGKKIICVSQWSPMGEAGLPTQQLFRSRRICRPKTLTRVAYTWGLLAKLLYDHVFTNVSDRVLTNGSERKRACLHAVVCGDETTSAANDKGVIEGAITGYLPELFKSVVKVGTRQKACA